MYKRRALIISSFVPAGNRAPVAPTVKMLRMCCDTFVYTDLLTANFPPEAVGGLGRFELHNLKVRVSSSPLGSLRAYLALQLRLLGRLRREDPARTLAIFWIAGPMLLPFLYCRWRGIPTVGFLHGNSRLKQGRPTLVNCLKARGMGFIARRAEVACVESPAVATHWGLDYTAGGMKCIHLYVDSAAFFCQIPLAQRPKVVGMCCRLVPSKRVLESIEAFHAFRADHPDYRLEIVGDGALRAECEALIRSLGEADTVSLAGWVDNADLPGYYNRWRLLLFPTNYEGLPNVLLEAMACGTPALSSPVGGVPDVVRGGENGFLLAGNTAAAIEAGLRGALRDEALLASASALAAREVSARFSYEKSLDDLRASLREIGE